jgi:CubicO group peptidase (beta-lactamase class C family)
MTNKVKVHGRCDERFAAVKEAFQRNFDSGQEVGASFAATIDGKFVVDIWGGYADAARTRPWKRDTIVNVWSTTKVMTAICALMLVDRGQLDLDAPVARYWPEFAQAGKEKIPVRYLLSHQSGLAVFDKPTPVEALYDWNRIINLLAAQKPAWEPGKHSGYHALTFGYLVGEVVRRITGKTPGTFFREEVAVPLNADFHIGLPEEHDHRVGEMIPPPVLKPGDPGYVNIDPDSLVGKYYKYSSTPVEATKERAWRAAEIPAANGHGNARSVARVGAAMACGGELDGVRLLGLPTIAKAIEEQCYGTDLFFGVPIRYGLGFGLNTKEMPISPNPRTFFWGGWGGSVMVMDLDARLSWGYVMNKMGNTTMGDPRSAGIAQALYAVL